MAAGSNDTTKSNFTLTDTSLVNYFRVELATAVILVFLCPITVTANSLLLSAIYKDPLRCFRTPTTYFIIGLALSDLFTGLLVEPSFILKYIAHYVQCGSRINCEPSAGFLFIYRIGGIISTIAISSSFIVVLALSISQYIAITYPHKYKQIVTKFRVVTCVILSWLYFILFSLLQFSGINLYTYLMIDLMLHPSLISVLLAIVHTLLYCSFRRHLSRSYTWRRTSFYQKTETNGKLTRRLKSKNKESRNRLNERQFTIVTFYLAGILLLSASTHSIVLYVYFFYTSKSYQANINIHIFLRISDMMLFLKVALDPFIYAWRLPTYRKALRYSIGTNKTTRNGQQGRIPNDRLTLFLLERRSRNRLIESGTGQVERTT